MAYGYKEYRSTSRIIKVWMMNFAAAVFFVLPALSLGQTNYFRINVVDSVTNRGIPGAMLITTNQAHYTTDSNGIIAFYRPDLMGKQVFFSVNCPGYTPPVDGLGIRGVRFVCMLGGSTTVKLTSNNIAERYYRVTGTGIYRDSQLLGLSTRNTQDTSTIPVVSQRGGETIAYRNSLFWLGNDTFGADSPLGNLRASCALSSLPLQAGYDPGQGMYLQYYRQGQAPKPMINIGYDMVRGGSLRTVADGSNPEKLLANYYQFNAASSILSRGLLLFDDQANQFVKVLEYPATASVIPDGPAFAHTDDGTAYTYFSSPWPNIRIQRTLAAASNLTVYQALTCLAPDSKINYTATQIDRDPSGNLRWGWARNTSPVGEAEFDQLIPRGLIREDEKWYKLIDVLTGNQVRIEANSGTVFWNEFRKRWISIHTETGGKTPAGEVWYFEGDTPLGPWIYGRKIVTHVSDGETTHSFRYPYHHPELDRQNGQMIFFDGFFTAELTPTRFAMPRYNNNRVMYRLDLMDRRLFLPVPVYRINGAGAGNYRTKTAISDSETNRIPVFMAPDRRDTTISPAIIQIWEYPDPAHNTVILSSSLSSPTGQAGTPAFFGVSSTGNLPVNSIVSLAVPLNEFIHSSTGQRIYSTDNAMGDPAYVKQANAVCRVWPYPIRFNPYAVPIKTGGANRSRDEWRMLD